MMHKEENSADTNLAEFTENTTIHGVKYLGGKNRPNREKIFWIVVFAIFFVCLGFFVQDVLTKYNQKSAILVEDDQLTPIHAIPFPAVTICPTVKIKSEFFPVENVKKWIGRELDESMILDLTYLICNQQFIKALELEKRFTKHLNKSHIELMHQITPSVEEIFMDTIFESKTEFEYTKFVPFSNILTNEGICFTFNLPSEILIDGPSLQTEYKYHNIENKTKSWSNEAGYFGYPAFPRPVWGIGPGSGLFVNMIVENADLTTFCQPTPIGYKIMLHSPDEYPTTLEKFISIPHNTMTQIKVTPKITKTSYELKKLEPQVRQCFFDHERKLNYFTYYNRVNCKLECLANYSMQQYGCVHFSLPRNNSQPICNANVQISQLYDTEEIINSYFQYKTKISDLFEAELDVNQTFDFQKFSNFHCNCLPACTSVDYEYSIEMENIELEKFTKKYFPNEMVNIMDSRMIFDIFFGVANVTGMTRKRYYTFSDLISNIGGLVGLFMGASILSVFEIIYFLIVR